MAKYVVFAGWGDVPHLSEETKAGLLSAYLPHERDARTRGVPSLGSGAIYPIDEQEIVCEPFEFPAWFEHCYALDVGWNRTAALWGARDPEDDVVYLYAEYYRGQAEPAIHAAAVRARGTWIPGVIDPAARGRGQKDGEQLLQNYIDLGLTTLTLANNAIYAGIEKVWGRLSTGRLKVFRNLQNFLGEYRIYRRDEKGAIVKANDHLMDCCRYLSLSGIDRAIMRPYDEWAGRPGTPVTANTGRGKLESSYNPYEEAFSVGKQLGPRRETWPGIGGWDRH